MKSRPLQAPQSAPTVLPFAAEMIDAENALLGVLLGDPTLTSVAARALAPWDFYDADVHGSPNAMIFDRLIEDAQADRVTEPQVLAAQLAPSLVAVGGARYIGDLIEKAPSAAGLPELIRQVATSAARRRIARSIADPGLSADGLASLLEAESRHVEAFNNRRRSLQATPYEWRQPQSIPRRQWLYDRHIIRRFVSATIAPGGVGKTMLLIVEALAMATGRPLLGVAVSRPLTVWLLNLEDPREELERRIAAACLHYGITAEDIGGRLYVDTGREADLVIARSSRNGVEVCTPCVRQLEREMLARQVDVLIVDPFVACHAVDENSNSAVNVVVKEWRELADRTDAGIDLVHHSRKAGAGQTETTVEDGRGASALLGGVRSARVLNPMSEAQATEWGIEERRLYFRVDNGKANLAPPAASAKWRKLTDVDLENGPAGHSDRAGVPIAWEPPGVLDGISAADLLAVQRAISAGEYRADPQSAAWVGHKIAEVLGWDATDPRDKARLKAAQRRWQQSGALRVEQRMDPRKREPKAFVAVGEWVQS